MSSLLVATLCPRLNKLSHVEGKKAPGAAEAADQPRGAADSRSSKPGELQRDTPGISLPLLERRTRGPASV